MCLPGFASELFGMDFTQLLWSTSELSHGLNLGMCFRFLTFPDELCPWVNDKPIELFHYFCLLVGDYPDCGTRYIFSILNHFHCSFTDSRSLKLFCKNGLLLSVLNHIDAY